MRYAAIRDRDISNGTGVCVSLWFQGCPFRCKGCHNPETWDFNGGHEANHIDVINKIIGLIGANGVNRNFSMLGGEPLCEENIHDAIDIAKTIKKIFPNITIYLWTGYLMEEIREHPIQKYILNYIDVLIDGCFDINKKDTTLTLRGSSNQKVYYLNHVDGRDGRYVYIVNPYGSPSEMHRYN